MSKHFRSEVQKADNWPQRGGIPVVGFSFLFDTTSLLANQPFQRPFSRAIYGYDG
jgi:hypothetical protein